VQQSAGTNLWQRNAYLIPLERWGDHGFSAALGAFPGASWTPSFIRVPNVFGPLLFSVAEQSTKIEELLFVGKKELQRSMAHWCSTFFRGLPGKST
jgi:hypothetical protein